MKEKNREKFLEKNSIGLILRVFATNETDISEKIKMTEELINRALIIKTDKEKIIKRIDVLVWADPNYKSDCGKTASVLQQQINNKKVFISEVKQGDLFCELLNYGVNLQTKEKIDYSIIASIEAGSYFNKETLEAIIDASSQGALAIGVAINELRESILEGRLANTFAMWHNQSLLAVGGFDLRAAKLTLEEEQNKNKRISGVEEIIPLALLVKKFGPCIAPILPQGKEESKYIISDKETYKKKMESKEEKQKAHLASLGYNFSFLQDGIMKEYK